MNAVKQYYTKDNPPPSISIISLVKNILKDSDLSKNASNILAQLVLASGYSGFCWMLLDTISKNSRLGRTQTKLYLKELVTKKRIKIHHRPGRSSRFEVLDITNELNEVSRCTDHIKEYKNKENVTIEKPNVILIFPDKDNHPIVHSKVKTTKQVVEEPSPTLAEDNNNTNITTPANNTGPAIQKPILHQQQKPIKIPSNVIDMSLVQQILDITNDKKSVGCFIKIVKNVPESIVYAAISSLKISMEENYILRPGAYFVGVIKNYFPEVFNTQTSPVTLSTQNNSSVVPLKTSKKPYFEPDEIVPASQEFAMESINKIKLILSKPSRSMYQG